MIYFGLLLFFFLEYVRPGNFIPGVNALHVNSLVPLGVVFGSFVKKSQVSNQALMRETNTKILMFWLFLIFMSVVFADVQMRASECFETSVAYALVYVAIVKLVTNLRRMVGVILAMIVVHLIVVALSPDMLVDPSSRSHYLAAGSFLGDGNDFALSVNIVIPLCLFLLLETKRMLLKIPYLAVLLFLVLCVIATQSRGGTIALTCVGVYYWLKSDKKILTGLVALAVVGLILICAPASYYERMNTITNNAEDGSAQGRIMAWRAAVRMAADHPLLGVGAAHFPVKFGLEYLPKNYIGEMTAHSIYFLALGELGLPGIGMLLYFIVSNLVANKRVAARGSTRDPVLLAMDKRLLNATSAALVAFVSGGLFLSALYYPHWYILAGLMTAARHMVLARDLAAEAAVQVPSVDAVSTRGLQRPGRRPASALVWDRRGRRVSGLQR
jgi:putative inorganic carbon (HCO3(-)) transporter